MAIINTKVDKSIITGLKKELYELAQLAVRIDSDSSFESIRKAQDKLNQAIGLHKALDRLGQLDETSVTQEDIERIQRKQMSILEDKRRHQGLILKGGRL